MADHDIDGYMFVLVGTGGYGWLLVDVYVTGIGIHGYMWLFATLLAATGGYSWLLVDVCNWN